MKHINLIVQLVLAVAVIVLFVLVLKANNANNTVQPKFTNGKGVTIAYFELDSLQNNFLFYKQKIEILDKKAQEIKRGLDLKKAENIARFKEYQSRFSSMTQQQQEEANRDMQRRESDYQMTEQQEGGRISGETRELLADVRKKVDSYLKEFNKNHVYTYIIANSIDMVFYKDTTLDITNELIKGLNKKYKAEK